MSVVNSTRRIKANKAGKSRKPKKPYPKFPLTPHPAGVWCKSIRGKLHYFGPWSEPDEALKRYNQQAVALHSGRTARTPEEKQAATLKEVCNRFRAVKADKVKLGRLSLHSFRDYLAMLELFKVFGKGRIVADLQPMDFMNLKAAVAERWGPLRIRDLVHRTKAVFNWALGMKLITQVPDYGPEFDPPDEKEIREARNAKGNLAFTAAELRAMLDAAGPQLKAMLLLGINAGYGNNDCAKLPLDKVDLELGWVTFPRPKTSVLRRCPLWPETVEALRQAIAQRPQPKREEHAGLVFLTRTGAPWFKDITSSPDSEETRNLLRQLSTKVKDDTYDKKTRKLLSRATDNPVSKETRKLLNRLKIRGPRNFYSLRRTFATVGSDMLDQVAVDFIMGHAPNRNDMSAKYRQGVTDARLVAVSNHVRNWLIANSEGK